MTEYTSKQITNAIRVGQEHLTAAQLFAFPVRTAAEAAEAQQLALFHAAATLTGPEFTIPELRRAVEALTASEQDPRNFARTLDATVSLECVSVRRGRGRPAQIYRFDGAKVRGAGAGAADERRG